jgi:uncharacterized protein
MADPRGTRPVRARARGSRGVARIAIAILAGWAVGAGWPLGAGAAGVADGEAPITTRPKVALIIDDIGYQRVNGQRAAFLPGPLSYAVLPHTPFAKPLADLLHRLDREVLVHMPMEPLGLATPGPGALHTAMERADVERSIRLALDSVPHARGLSNHMGSRATADPRLMGLMMEALAGHARSALFFLDSRTTPESVTRSAAAMHGVPHITRDVFLDNVRRPEVIRAQLHRLIDAAHRRGHAIGIGHPYPETLDVLASELPRMQDRGVTLVPISTLAYPGATLSRLSAPGARDVRYQ